mgnify:CR=1 FL=1
MRNVLMILRSSKSYDLAMLEGIIKYSQEVGGWNVYRLVYQYYSQLGDDAIVEQALKWNIEIVFGRLSNSLIQKLKNNNILPVTERFEILKSQDLMIFNDSIKVGEVAADYFIEHRFQQFAFCGTSASWSTSRLKGFEARIKNYNPNISVYKFITPPPLNDPCPTDVFTQIYSWLSTLPSGCALFACDDEAALIVIDACNFLRIKVPSDISVVGVGNDGWCCTLANPNLSTIPINNFYAGYEAAKKADILLKTGIIWDNVIITGPKPVIERGSSSRFSTRDKVTQAVLGAINDALVNKSGENCSVDQILKNVPYVRRTCEMHFKKEMGIPIYKFYMNEKIKRISNELTQTDLPVQKVILEYGFSDYPHFCRLFKKVMKMSPRQYIAESNVI